jgi:pyruvate formate lyase activating enzyme
VKLDTNGSTPKVLGNLLDENLLDYVAMDVKYPLDRYEELSGKYIDIELYKASIEIIKARLPDYEFRTTVIK